MLTILAQQATAPPETSQLDTYLKYGQMGLALAIVVVGAGLFTAAVKQQNLSETTARVLKLFATVMVVLFVVSFLGEMATKYMEFLDKRRPVVTRIEVFPLSKNLSHDKFPVEIAVMDNPMPSPPPKPVHADQPQEFSVHNGAQIRIDVETLIERLRSSQTLANSATEKTAAKGALGGEAPQ
jgi:hypothetical protein